MASVLSLLRLTSFGEIFGRPAFSVFIPKEVFVEYHLKAFDCTIIGDFLDICRFVVQDKGEGNGSRLLADLDQWAKGRGLRLCLSPLPYGDNSELASRRLVAFYKRQGFIETPEGEWCPEAMYKP